MDKLFYFDELTQSFVSNGNVFLKLGAISGNVDSSGQDIKSQIATLVIPLELLQIFSTNINLATQAYCGPFNEIKADAVEPTQTHRLGQPLIIPP